MVTRNDHIIIITKENLETDNLIPSLPFSSKETEAEMDSVGLSRVHVTGGLCTA